MTTRRTQYRPRSESGSTGRSPQSTRCPDTNSADRTLNVQGGDASCPSNPGRATLLSPANGATNLASPVTFHWNAVPKATSYRVIASFGNSAPFSLGTTTTTTLSADVPAGSGNWLVQAVFGENCPTTLSDRRTLTVTTGATCSNAAPQLVTPPDGATNVGSPVTFQWTAVTDATSYRLFLAAGNGGFEFYGETTGTSLQRLVTAGNVKWFVIADFAACPDTRSTTSSFTGTTFDDCAAASINLTSPAQNATTGSPVHWLESVAGAQFYRVWASINAMRR